MSQYTLSLDRPVKDRIADNGEGWHRLKSYGGTCLSFDGTNDYIDIGDISQEVQTIMFIIQPDSTTEDIIDLDGGTHTIEIVSGVITATGFTDSTIYIDGIENNEVTIDDFYHVTITTDTAIDVNDLDIGRVSSSYFDGKISNVLMFTTPLSAEDIFFSYMHPESPVPVGVSSSTLVGWWPLNENDATFATAVDHSSNGKNGTLTGPTYINGYSKPIPQSLISGYSDYYYFDGSNDYISFSGITEDFSITGYFSMSIVFYMPSGDQTIFSSNYHSSNDRFIIQRSSSNFLVATNDGTSVIKSTTSYIPGKLYTLTLTIDNKAVTAFLDGVEMTSTSGTPSITSNVNTIIGTHTNGVSFPYKGIVVSVEQTGKHKWTNTGGWVDEIGTADGTLNGTPGQFRLTAGTTTNKDPYGFDLQNLKGKGYFLGNEYGETPDKDNLDITTSITLAAWVKFTNTGSQETIIAKRNCWELAKSSAETVIMSVYQTTNKFTLSTTTLSADTWYYIVGTYTSGTMQIYINGVLDKTDTSYTGSIDTSAYNTTVGQLNGSTYYTGQIDEVKVYNAVKTTDEIVTNYRAGLAAHP